MELGTFAKTQLVHEIAQAKNNIKSALKYSDLKNVRFFKAYARNLQNFLKESK
jgi:hypothetical protein